MTAADLDAAALVWRLAFGTHFGAQEPARFREDMRFIETRFATDPAFAFVAERDGRILGSIIGMDWGSQLVLGPLSVDPAFWGKGLARLLVARFLAAADARGTKLTTLFTFPQSTVHLGLYESFGFVPMYLTPILGKAVGDGAPREVGRLFSALPAAERGATLAACSAVTDELCDGLDLRRQIEAMAAQRLGETVLVERDGAVAGFAICHLGVGSEAGAGVLFVKFAAVRPGAAAEFERLLDAVEALAAARAVRRIALGINTGRRDAYRRVVARGFRAEFVGVAMHRPDGIGTLGADRYVIDDWR
jgi:predicted N-acetyltransferase YhbS